MDAGIETVKIIRLTEEGRENIEDTVVRELPVTIILNNEELVTMLCSPENLDHMAIGFLFSEGLLKEKDELKNILVDEKHGIVRVNTSVEKEIDSQFIFKRMITSGCGRGASFYRAADAEDREQIKSGTKISIHQVLSLMKEFQMKSELFRKTGGVHSAALCDTEKILVFKEDIGRHNAIDKIFGQAMLENIPTEDRVVVTSGRISSEILLKVSKRNVPIIISKSAPTDLGVRLAGELGMTLLGFARGKRVNVYTNDWRIKDNGSL